jgi:hypothetical protein
LVVFCRFEVLAGGALAQHAVAAGATFEVGLAGGRLVFGRKRRRLQLVRHCGWRGGLLGLGGKRQVHGQRQRCQHQYVTDSLLHCFVSSPLEIARVARVRSLSDSAQDDTPAVVRFLDFIKSR